MMRHDADCYAGSIRLRPEAAQAPAALVRRIHQRGELAGMVAVERVIAGSPVDDDFNIVIEAAVAVWTARTATQASWSVTVRSGP
jgi:hypothetical protein